MSSLSRVEEALDLLNDLYVNFGIGKEKEQAEKIIKLLKGVK